MAEFGGIEFRVPSSCGTGGVHGTSDMASNSDFGTIVDELSNPATYPHRPPDVEVRETHASVAFLAGDEVYKLKKPVDFGFLDYSTLDRRREMCRLEVELNRRLAPDVYLGVETVVNRDGRIALGGDGEPVDYLVHMRRLPDEAALHHLIKQESVDDSRMEAIAEVVARFHSQAGRSAEIDRFGALETVSHNVEENFEQIEPYIGRTIPHSTFDRITDYSRRFMRENEGIFRARIDAGLICDGHGDLRAEHVYVLPNGRIEIIDCIEFNDRLRYGDVAVDLGFLAMDLDALGRPDLSDTLASSYRRESHYDLDPVFEFYKCYRAVVRGKVASFRLNQPGLRSEAQPGVQLEARRFFHIAQRYAAGDRGPRLLIMVGLTGSGKSTIARNLGEVLPATVIDSDTTRKELAGLGPMSRQENEYQSGIYSPEMSAKVYATLLERAGPLLKQGRTVILDATYIQRSDREAAKRLARQHGARFAAVHCDVSDDLARERLAERSGDPNRVSDGRWEIYVRQREAFDPLNEIATNELIRLDVARLVEASVEKVMETLEEPKQ